MKIEELKRKIEEQTNGKLSEEQINQIIEKAGLEEVIVHVTSDPYEYGEASIEDEDDDVEKIEGIIGDTKGGEYYYDPYQGETVDESANFSLSQIQASIKTWKLEEQDVKRFSPTTINIYLPEQEYDVVTFKELVERDKMQKLVTTIKEKTNGRLSDEQISKIIEESGLVDTSMVLVTSDPYKYGRANEAETGYTMDGDHYESIDEEIEGIIGDTEGGKYESNESANFSLNQAQSSVIRRTKYDYYEGYDEKHWYYSTLINIYLPEQEYDVETFKELLEKDEIQRKEIIAKGEEASLEGIKEEMIVIEEDRTKDNEKDKKDIVLE